MKEVFIRDERSGEDGKEIINGSIITISGSEKEKYMQIYLNTGYMICLPWKKIANQIVIQKLGGE